MHVLIMGQPYVDHVNSNGLDNRRANLRPANQTQNAGNSRARQTPGKTSRYKGVFWERRRSHWVAKITDHGKLRSLGHFASEEVFGEFARLNFSVAPKSLP
jgi:hypothetical protein